VGKEGMASYNYIFKGVINDNAGSRDMDRDRCVRTGKRSERNKFVKKKERYRNTLPSLNPISYEKPNRVIQSTGQNIMC
jgi:hypothetical protein